MLMIIAVGLAMDAFSVAVATSVRLKQVSGRQVFRFAFHFGLFQAMMPTLGWLLGKTMVHYIQQWDHWLAFGLLSAIGVKALYDVFWGEEEEEEDRKDPTRGRSLIVLSIATSIDALAVGLSFAFLQLQLWYPCLIIGVITTGLTALGMLLGVWIGGKLGRYAEVSGALILIGIGLKILVDHTLWV